MQDTFDPVCTRPKGQACATIGYLVCKTCFGFVCYIKINILTQLKDIVR